MHIIGLIIIGAAAGFLATRLMKVEADILTTIAIGIFGALIGGLVLRFLIALTGFAAGFVGAVLGAILLIWLWDRYGPSRR
ncbi:GlsB/YeaQ/YmgE family stress response membrane protein [Albidovulum sp.]|uniref:GlsB/YeaQ/YmgE family stress response membrane protein n=1 Tax=Albidovulum sp. TaxID=1872424 RepID=UPI001D465304|nr:GlsB/YeaQ/YmgE family stress response membrane protein [Paracoccaceae bacterium]HPE24059.1 GlsB/YeaQ/YmgE family stress response membrane protein [Albidovulum sp.]MCB2122937.1 GlsB/YeaQ/YmgE family stress response membrane protein [Paracoccaceae bacterium]MCB2132540.1 GlsB/YeaQ/YmgE family stress response membrane protein [Paracoccaceae bacterium]MCB2138337.1 GlsB/YeaQ/YmgE family stress response membrane protein [Paracoccaceae bacterium]